MKTVDLVNQIYESVGDSEALDETLLQIAQFTESRGTQLGVIDKTGHWAIATVPGLDPELLDAYVKDYAADDPRMAFSIRNPGRLVACHQITDRATFEHSALVNDLLDKYGVRFAMAALIPVDQGYSALCCLMRARRDGQYSHDQINRLSRLIPHLRRAISLHIRLGRLESQLTSLDALVDRLAAPVLLVDKTGLLRHANTAGQEALRGAEYLALRNGHVRPRSMRQEQRFADTLAAALSDDQATVAEAPSASMRLLDGEGHAAILVVQALRGQANFSGMPQADAVLFLIRSDEKALINTPRLQMVFGLTPAETRLAEYLVSGESLMGISERLHLSRETLKTQLGSLFDKTGTNRQSKLVALLLSSTSVSIA